MKFQINQNSPRGGSFISSSTLAHPAIDTLQVLKLVYMYIVQTLYFDKFRKLYFIFRLQNYINVCTFLFFLLSLAINPYFQTHFLKFSCCFVDSHIVHLFPNGTPLSKLLHIDDKGNFSSLCQYQCRHKIYISFCLRLLAFQRRQETVCSLSMFNRAYNFCF